MAIHQPYVLAKSLLFGGVDSRAPVDSHDALPLWPK